MRHWITRRFIACLTAAAAAWHTPAFADSGDWRLSGFGTVGVVRATDEQASLLRFGINMPGREGPDFGADSILGVQASRSFDAGFDLTAQAILREDQSGHVDPRLAWAFVRFAPLADLEFRLGRMRAPFFMFSESIWINYANIWVRPPTEVYGLNPFSDLDGADLMWHSRVNGFDVEVRPFIGRSLLELRTRRAKLKRIVGLNLALFRNDFSLHLGHAESPFSLPWNDQVYLGVSQALRSAGFGQVADEMSGDDGYARFDALGLQWDNGRYLAIAEFARREVNRYIPTAHGWELTLGRRLGPLTAYGVLARQTQDSPAADADLSAIPPLQSALDLFNATRNSAQSSLTAGLRWDFDRHAAIKLEFSRVRIADQSLGSFFPVEDSGVIEFSKRRLNLMSLSLDASF